MRARTLGLIALIGFILHLVWENAQAPLYQGYVSFTQHFIPCLRATFGDVFILFVIYFAQMMLTKDKDWIRNLQLSTVISTVLMGMGIAIIIEWYALTTGRWEYAGMPVVWGIGILPVLQMAILNPLTFYLTSRIEGSA